MAYRIAHDTDMPEFDSSVMPRIWSSQDMEEQLYRAEKAVEMADAMRPVEWCMECDRPATPACDYH